MKKKKKTQNNVMQLKQIANAHEIEQRMRLLEIWEENVLRLGFIY